MKALLFNIHDISLLLAIGVFFLLVASQLRGRNRLTRTDVLWTVFFALNILSASHTLIFWSESIRYRVFDAFSSLFLLLSVIPFLTGPVLYFLLLSALDKNFRFRGFHALHLVPVLLAVAYLYGVCFRYDADTQRELYLELRLYQQPAIYYFQFVSLGKLLPLGYAVFGLVYVLRYDHRNKRFATPVLSNFTLKILASGFTLLWAWAAITHFVGRAHPGAVSDNMGIAGNYINLALAVALIFHRQPKSELRATSQADMSAIDQAVVDKIVSAMSEQQAYLNPQLTLERFASLVELTPRDVSVTINRKYQQNFHEFVNSYRVEAAKKKLRDSAHQEISINEIARASGFNSRATFNRFFKKLVLSTPSSYRKKHQNSCAE